MKTKSVIRKDDKKLDEGVYLRKGKFGYRLVYPFTHEDGTVNWFNFFTGGSWMNLLKWGIVVALILFSCWAYYHDVIQALEVCNNVYARCSGIILP